MVTLKHERAGRFFVIIGRSPGRAGHFNTCVYHYTVVSDFFEASISNLLAAFVKARSVEDDIVRLPLSGR